MEVEAVNKNYGATPVLRGVGFSLGEGDRLAIMGPSGSGKSTLLNCLGGIEVPDAGAIRFAGQDLAALDENARAELRRTRIGFVFQFFYLLPTLTAAENVELPLQFARMAPRERRDRARALLDEVGVGHRADGLPQQLSGGEMQRVALARALAQGPDLLLADEPTGNLDSARGGQVLELLDALCQRHRTALILVTHQAETASLCERTVHLRDGRLEATGAR